MSLNYLAASLSLDSLAAAIDACAVEGHTDDIALAPGDSQMLREVAAYLRLRAEPPPLVIDPTDPCDWRKVHMAELDAKATQHHLPTYTHLLHAMHSALPLIDGYRRLSGGDGDLSAANFRHYLRAAGIIN